jgi:hypothetical protein
LRVASEQGHEAFHLSLGIADEAAADFIVRGLRRRAKGRDGQCNERYEACCEAHLSLLFQFTELSGDLRPDGDLIAAVR